VMVLLNIGLNLLLIPRWSGSGAAIATVATETAGLLLGTFYIRRRIAPLAYGAALVKPTLATVAVALVAVRYPLLAALPVYAAAYAALLWAVHGVSREDVDFLRALLRRPRTTLLTGSGR